ncbi:hypothetical protein [Streptomyces roseoverticillatus]|uniref:Uncharacterized protein n=1 Tax=Streptomyces roseoverticillatus TaxID=66429 RepID=A0ABV3J526_9ACTN
MLVDKLSPQGELLDQDDLETFVKEIAWLAEEGEPTSCDISTIEREEAAE